MFSVQIYSKIEMKAFWRNKLHDCIWFSCNHSHFRSKSAYSSSNKKGEIMHSVYENRNVTKLLFSLVIMREFTFHYTFTKDECNIFFACESSHYYENYQAGVVLLYLLNVNQKLRIVPWIFEKNSIKEIDNCFNSWMEFNNTTKNLKCVD